VSASSTHLKRKQKNRKKKSNQKLLLRDIALLGKGEQLTPLIFWLIWPSRKHEEFLRKHTLAV